MNWGEWKQENLSRAAEVFKRTDLVQNGDCLEWPPASGTERYGRIRGPGFDALVSHVAWWLATGEVIPPGMLVCHSCDNPPCAKGEHLFLGTKSDNARDAYRKGRLHPLPIRRGEAHLMAKLTQEQADSIRRDFSAGGITKAALARRYSVSWTAIDDVIKHRRWNSVPTKPAGAQRDVLTVSEAAALLRLYPKTLRKLAYRGEIPAFRITTGPKGHLRFRRSVIEAWMRDREAEMRRETEAIR